MKKELVLLSVIVVLAVSLFFIPYRLPTNRVSSGEGTDASSSYVLPLGGVVVPARWGDLGMRLIGAGVIDQKKFEAIYASRGGLDQEARSYLERADNGMLRITSKNAGVLLNLLWAFGLSNKNPILEQGPMAASPGTKTANFASTGGWTLSAGNVMAHYSAHQFIALDPEAQQKVERTSKNIYRPCCNNSTYFPDCNHGMAMLGLLELMASQGVSEDEMYRAALAVNSYWFPDTYLTIAKYLRTKGIEWRNADPKEILGFSYSSASGYGEILKSVTPEKSSGGSCGV